MPRPSKNIFATAYKKDYLDIFDNKAPKYSRIKKFLDFKNEDIAKATDTKLISVRWEECRIPKSIKDRFAEWAVLLNLVAGFFDGDVLKTTLWFKTSNPLLGNISPRDMIRFGHYKKLLNFIVASIEENRKS